MPIPKPKKGEKQKDYVSRCIHFTAKEFKDHKQAVAVCYSTFRQHKGKKK